MAGPDEWRAAVMCSPELHDRTKLVLLAGYEHTDPRLAGRGLISVGRAELAKAINATDPGSVSKRFSEAIKAGFLVVESKGGYGRPTIYRRTIEGVSVAATTTVTTESVSVAAVTTVSPQCPVDNSGVSVYAITTVPKVTAASNQDGASAAAATSVDAGEKSSRNGRSFSALQENDQTPATRQRTRRHITLKRDHMHDEQKRQLRELEKLMQPVHAAWSPANYSLKGEPE